MLNEQIGENECGFLGKTDVFRQITGEFRRQFVTIEYAVFHTDRETENYRAFKRAFGK